MIKVYIGMGVTFNDVEEAVVEELVWLAFEEDCLLVKVVEERNVELGR